MKIKILYRKNLKMSEGKLAAQAVHAALLLYTQDERTSVGASVVVLGVSDKKFEEGKNGHSMIALIKDKGLTEVAPGTETCYAFLEEYGSPQAEKEVE